MIGFTLVFTFDLPLQPVHSSIESGTLICTSALGYERPASGYDQSDLNFLLPALSVEPDLSMRGPLLDTNELCEALGRMCANCLGNLCVPRRECNLHAEPPFSTGPDYFRSSLPPRRRKASGLGVGLRTR